MRRSARFGFGAAFASLACLFGGVACSSGVSAQRAGQDTGPAARQGSPQDPGSTAQTAPAVASAHLAAVRRYEYVFPDGSMYVYDMDAGQRLVQRVVLPTTRGVRGVVASPSTHTLYISYGGDGGSNGSGSLLAYDLLAGRVLWQRSYPNGIDSMAISPDGSRIYMPSGELEPNGIWGVLDARDGHVITTIQGGAGPHNTVMSLDGRHVYLGGRRRLGRRDRRPYPPDRRVPAASAQHAQDARDRLAKRGADLDDLSAGPGIREVTLSAGRPDRPSQPGV
jgi:hypothetical protein